MCIKCQLLSIMEGNWLLFIIQGLVKSKKSINNKLPEEVLGVRLYTVSSPEEVLGIIKKNFSPLEEENLEVELGGERILGQDITALEDVPGFNRSTVDGYALRAADTFGAGDTLPAMLNLAGEVKMGEQAPSLARGSGVYVPTGGMIPSESDAVIMIEDTEIIGDLFNCYRQVAPGENVIKKGEDVSRGETILKRGKRLRAVELGVLASLGITQIKVAKKPRVAILSSGDEIVPYPTKQLEPGQIRDSNALALAEIIRHRGGEPFYGGILQDTYPVFRQAVNEMLQKVDFLVLSGGSSVGARDHTAAVLTELSDNGLLVEGMAVQPGKPTLLAKCQGKPVLGLPGHPVSALNIFTFFGAYIMDRLLGIEDETFIPTVQALLARNIPSRIGRTDYVRVRLQRIGDHTSAVPVFGRSGLLRTLSEAHGIVVVPPGSEGINAGKNVEVILWE